MFLSYSFIFDSLRYYELLRVPGMPLYNQCGINHALINIQMQSIRVVTVFGMHILSHIIILSFPSSTTAIPDNHNR